MSGNIDQLIAERQKTHGDFEETAFIAQSLKDFYRSCRGWARLDPVKRESFDMNAVKDARILAGDSDFAEHFHDKAGYSMLAATKCTK